MTSTGCLFRLQAIRKWYNLSGAAVSCLPGMKKKVQFGEGHSSLALENIWACPVFWGGLGAIQNFALKPKVGYE
jgi:hypothetical protein